MKTLEDSCVPLRATYIYVFTSKVMTRKPFCIRTLIKLRSKTCISSNETLTMVTGKIGSGHYRGRRRRPTPGDTESVCIPAAFPLQSAMIVVEGVEAGYV